MRNTTLDTTGWTVYEPAKFLCVDAYTGNSNTPGGLKPVFILELYNEEKQITVTEFFNCKKTKKDYFAVDKNSAFACLYRVAIGKDPRARYSKAKQLLSHLIGLEFTCEYEEAKDRKGALYFRAKTIQPVNHVTNETWFINGKLKNKRGRKSRRQQSTVSRPNERTIKQQEHGNEQDISRQNSGNKLEIVNTDKASNSNALNIVSTTYQHLTSLDSNVESLHHSEYETLERLSSKERFYHYHPKPNENENEYIERVLNDSISRW